MKVIKRIKQNNYTTISNAFLRNRDLSLKAKALLAMVMSLPDNWDFTVNGLVSLVKEGETVVRGAIKELKEKGYCKVDIIRNGARITKWLYCFREDLTIPFPDNLLLENLQVENLHVENQAQINKDNKENKDLNKKRDIVVEKDPDVLRFLAYMQKEYPHVCKMKNPMTLEEYNKLRELGYTPDQIASKLDVLENRDDYIRRYRSPYLCVRNWLKSDLMKVKR